MINNFECQECGSQVAEFDGFFVCQGCGLTVDEPVIQCNIGSFKTDNKGNAIQAHALLLNSTQIGNTSERKFKKSHINFARLNKINRSLSVEEKDTARVIFKNLIAQSGIDSNIDLFLDQFNKVFPKIKKYTKSRNLHLFCTTIYYLVMVQQTHYVSLKTLLAEQDIDHREFFICIKAIHNELPDLFKERAETLGVMIGQNISKVCEELRLSPEVRRVAFKISEKFADKLGYKSRIIAGSAVSIASRIVAEKKSISVIQISDCLEITASTVYSYLKRIKIELLRKNYQDYLDSLITPIPVIVPKESVHEKIKKLEVAPTEMETYEPINSIISETSIPANAIEKKVKKISRKRTSQFITDNKSIFSRFVPNQIQLGSFGLQSKESKFIGLPRNLNISEGPSIFSGFEFSPPIS